MKISRIQVDNFKSLVGFELELTDFNCLVGLNGAGKSTVLQFLDFIAQQFKGDIDGWLEARQWEAADLNSRLTKDRNIQFVVDLQHEDANVQWSGSFNRSTLHCTTETISWGDQTLLKVEEGKFTIYDLGSRDPLIKGDVAFDYQGSILSQLKDTQLPKSLLEMKHYFSELESMDLLSPELLRSRTREAKGKLGLGGQNLSAFLYELEGSQKDSLVEKIKQVYPQIEKLHVAPLRSGWKSLSIEESYNKHRLATDARHVNDGMLRIIAVLAQLASDHSFLLFDEIENGIHPALVEFLMDVLVASKKQVLVTTHSPMVLNYLEDNVAKAGVIHLYKTAEGYTRAIPLFDIPSMAEKLTVMGPGEVFVDTDFAQMANEIDRLRNGSD